MDFIKFRCDYISESCEKWRIFFPHRADAYVMISNLSGVLRIAPLLLLKINIAKFKENPDAKPSKNALLGDKLRWYRMHHGLRQEDIAKVLGVSRGVYGDIENGGTKSVPFSMLKNFASLYSIPVTALMDDYDHFLRDGQANRIRAHREKLGMTPTEYAAYLGAQRSLIHAWENNKKTVSRQSWEKYFKDCNK